MVATTSTYFDRSFRRNDELVRLVVNYGTLRSKDGSDTTCDVVLPGPTCREALDTDHFVFLAVKICSLEFTFQWLVHVTTVFILFFDEKRYAFPLAAAKSGAVTLL